VELVHGIQAGSREGVLPSGLAVRVLRLLILRDNHIRLLLFRIPGDCHVSHRHVIF
jgi:hypothetical protein